MELRMKSNFHKDIIFSSPIRVRRMGEAGWGSHAQQISLSELKNTWGSFSISNQNVLCLDCKFSR